ncbi:hypothetical protein LQ327_20830 [Actinomycetospora endophytica]|uniref:Capsular polysaccharide biosynthesis protein n=1 Tax=Actinomycetospora endophytica TaxID=2291215 RepID=A0ABS8PEI8_9PSEU|nr:hypothetical protein [Actinomycetospora endophytica]MCD2195821.1 hypothetical protein [Actinomycetospora endophytica]
MTDDRDDRESADGPPRPPSPRGEWKGSDWSTRTVSLIPSTRPEAGAAGAAGTPAPRAPLAEDEPGTGVTDPTPETAPAGLTGPGAPPAPRGPAERRGNGDGSTAADSAPESEPGPPDGTAHTALGRREIRRLTVIGVLLVLLGGAVGFGASLLWPTEYAGKTSVLYIISQEQPTGFLREDRNLTTQAMLAQSNAVLGPVAAQYGLTAAQLGQKLTVTVPDGSELLNFQVRDPSPDLAVRLADSVTKQYLQISASSQPSSDQMRYLQGQLTAAQNQMQQLRVDGSAPALAQLPAVADRAGSLGSQLDTLMLAQVAQPQAQVVAPAYLDGAVSPRPGFGAATGAVCGLLVALVTVVVLARRWQRRGPGS